MLKPEEQIRIILKGVHTLVNEEELLLKLKKSFERNKPLTIKLGLDPSAPDIHLGHGVVLRKIKQMQDLGHQVVIIIGDFTGKIGDPTGKSKGRVALTDEQVKDNAQTYCQQIFKILDKNKTEVRFNSEWLSKLNFEDVIKLASTTTVARILERDDFQKRYENQISIGIHEFFTSLYHSPENVEKAIEYYDAVFSKKTIPEDIPEIAMMGDKRMIADIISQLIEMDFVKSKSEFIRLVNQGGVQINSQKLILEDLNRIINHGDVIKIGKKRFVKFKI